MRQISPIYITVLLVTLSDCYLYTHNTQLVNDFDISEIFGLSVRINMRGVITSSSSLPSHPFLPRVAIWIIHSVQSLVVYIERLKFLRPFHLILYLLQHNLQIPKERDQFFITNANFKSFLS